MMVPAEGSVAPVHNGRDLSNYRTPAEARLLCPDLLQLPAPEEPAHTTCLRGPQGLVQVIERRARVQGQDHRLQPERVTQVPGDLARGDEERQVPCVMPAAQVLHHEVQ